MQILPLRLLLGLSSVLHMDLGSLLFQNNVDLHTKHAICLLHIFLVEFLLDTGPIVSDLIRQLLCVHSLEANYLQMEQDRQQG